VEYDDFRLVLDLGFGTLPRLLEHCPADRLDAVVITHEHSDHCVDLNGLLRALYYTPARTEAHAWRLPLYCPPGVVRRIDPLEPRMELSDVFEIHDLPGTYALGPFTLETTMLPHYVPNAGVRLVAQDLVLAYTGDCGPSPELAKLGAAADLFIVESTYDDRFEKSEPRYLSFAREAGEYASAAAAKKLMLTHFWPNADQDGTETSIRARAVAEASETFSGPIVAADEGLTVEFGQREKVRG
jgi:ribonuclease BN (tRNA processing enzyme)